MNYIEKLAETRILWISFITTIVCTVAFQVIAGQYGLIMLDAISDPDQSRAAISSMSDSQRILHAWVTGTLDVAYPAAYGALFVGSAHKFFPKFGHLLAAPVLVLVPIDLVEGIVQILGLTNMADWLGSKAVLTPAKLLFFSYGLLMTVCGWIAWLVGRFTSPRTME